MTNINNTNELKPVKERINKHKVKTLKIVKTLKFVGRPVSHKALSSAALLRGRPDGVVVNTSALESRGRGFKSRSGQFLGFSLCVCLYIYIDIYNRERERERILHCGAKI